MNEQEALRTSGGRWRWVVTRHWWWVLLPLVALLLLFLLFSNDPRIWTVRNTLEYHALHAWWRLTGAPEQGAPATVSGTVTGTDGAVIEGTDIALVWWDGSTYQATSDGAGEYIIDVVPAGRYRLVAGAHGYVAQSLGHGWERVRVTGGEHTLIPIILERAAPREVAMGNRLEIGEAHRRRCEEPRQSRAERRDVMFLTGTQPNQSTFLYTPVSTTQSGPYPLLLTVYPGPVETWDCTSVPLADAGYAVLAVSPAYSLNLERDVDELEQLLQFAREGRFPEVDSERVALIGGSYSAILTQRLVQRRDDIDAMVLLGAPTDLFDIRRRFESGETIPPFGLDRVLIALGFPDRSPLPYWLYSSVYHLRPDLPPYAIFHSRQDEIVPYQQSERLADVLRERGVPHELHLFDGGTHYLLEEGERAIEIYEMTLDFLARHLR